MTSTAQLHLASTAEANTLLAKDPLALLIAMLLDQQVPMEKAFTSPAVLRDRLGHDLDAAEIAGYDTAALETLFRTPPALHRFPAAMAKRVQAMAQVLVDEFDGDPARVWTGAKDGTELISRVGRLPGFGAQKAKIFAALLGKQFGIRPEGWREATAPYGDEGTYRSVADVVDDASLGKVREYKKALKAAAKSEA
jgi:uncharacterized HhH-GPD family protein